MSTKRGIYSRGDFWLDHERRNGNPVSQALYIFWYDGGAGKVRRQSTRTADVRIASELLDQRYLASQKSSPDDREAYTVHDAMTDYWIEAGSKKVSSDAIRARLKLFTRFLEAEIDAGRLRDPVLVETIDNNLLTKFREWAVADPILTKKRALDGNWTHSSRPRSPSTAEESIIALKAALNHNKARMPVVPQLKHYTRKQVTPERHYRLSLEALAEILDFTSSGAGNYAGHAERLLPLRRYFIAAISTLARPDAIFDMSVVPARQQWFPGAGIFSLNPAGRLQTKKHRPTLPVPTLLEDWLRETDGFFICREARERIEKKGLDDEEVIFRQARVASVKSAWGTVCDQFHIPEGWGPKLIRHSVATILTARRVNLVELEMALGHRVLSPTTAKYAIFDPDYLSSVRACVEDIWEELARRCSAPLHPNFSQKRDDGLRSRLRAEPGKS